MKGQSDDPSHHERTVYPRSYISLSEEIKSLKPRGTPDHVVSNKNIYLRCVVIYTFWNESFGSWYSVRSWRDWSSDQSFMNAPLGYFLFQPGFDNWWNKCRVMYYPVYRLVHIKYPLLLIGKCIPWSGGSGFPLSLPGWSFIICPYNRK